MRTEGDTLVPTPYVTGSLRIIVRLTSGSILLLSACAPQLPPVSADTSCERFRHISATDAQIRVFSDNWEVMESYADAIVSHNIEYDKQCLPVVK